MHPNPIQHVRTFIGVLHRNLTREGAMKIVNSYPSNKHHMVVFIKQFWANKWFIKKEVDGE